MLIEAIICTQLCVSHPEVTRPLPYEVETAIIDMAIWRHELRHSRQLLEVAPGVEIRGTRARFDHALQMCLLIAYALGDSSGQNCPSQ